MCVSSLTGGAVTANVIAPNTSIGSVVAAVGAFTTVSITDKINIARVDAPNIRQTIDGLFTYTSGVERNSSPNFTFILGRGTDWNAGKDFTLNTSGNFGFGLGSAASTALMHLAASTVSRASFKLNQGALLSTPENGVLEFDGTNYYLTAGGIRRIVTVV